MVYTSNTLTRIKNHLDLCPARIGIKSLLEKGCLLLQVKALMHETAKKTLSNIKSR
jgi:hypothetical protein